MSDVPHFALPFRFQGTQAATSEQDSIDEISDCVLAVLVCPRGYRSELPDFGIPDPTFSSPLDEDVIRNAIATWEPRADALIDAAPDVLDSLITRVELLVQVRTES